jgi:hypothetical protein
MAEQALLRIVPTTAFTADLRDCGNYRSSPRLGARTEDPAMSLIHLCLFHLASGFLIGCATAVILCLVVPLPIGFSLFSPEGALLTYALGSTFSAGCLATALASRDAM